jgi:uncharacterized protein (DUF1800 family)
MFKRFKTKAAAALLGTAMLVVACGGGSGGGSSTPPPEGSNSGPPAQASVTPEQASRFLAQATFGPTPADVERVSQVGYERWLQEQFLIPASRHQDAVPKFGDPISPKFFGFYPIQSSFWRQAATAPDALRQRVMFALSQIFVVSINDMAVIEHPRGVASYMDMLATHALGNYRDLIEGVALHPMMGLYLSHLGNRREDPASGRVPDENFARELMQLFSIGVDELQADGTPRLDAKGQRIETYSNDDVMGMARVFTGWSWHAPTTSDAYFFAVQTNPLQFSPDADPNRDVRPMQLYPQHHSSSEKKLLGLTIPAGTDGNTSLRLALDRLAAHPNVGPFIGKQLIQRLVSSNPSPAYVQRVAAVFNNNGQGTRGDLNAVVRAVLLDPEARQEPEKLPSAQALKSGKLREPMLRITHWMRAFNVRSNSGSWAYYFTSDPITSIGQSPMQSPSVFNFYRPGYVPPRSEIGAAGGVAPEMQIVGETTTASYINVAESTVGYFGTGFLLDLNTDYAAEMALADKPEQLLDRVALLLTAGRLSADSRALIRQAIDSVPQGDFLWRENRARMAVLMVMASPDFIVQK